jgi:pilus assembly protein Flp/PilA
MIEEISRKRRWYSGEGNCGVVGCVNSVSGCLVLKFSRYPTEKTLDGSMPGRNLRQQTKRRREVMLKKLMAKMQNEEGQGLVEYALIIVLVSIVVIAALSMLGTNVSTVFQNIATTLDPGGS